MSESTKWIIMWAVSYVAIAAMMTGFAIECAKPKLTKWDLVIAVIAGVFWPLTFLIAIGARIAKDAQ